MLREPAVTVPRAASRLVRIATPLAVLVIVAGTFLLRVIPALPYVFPAHGETRFFDPDSYYHLRHTKYAATHSFHLQRWDPSVYPTGEPASYAGLLDLGTAALAMIAGGGKATPETVEKIAPWVPPTLAAAAVFVAFLIGRLAVGRLTGVLAALFVFLFCGTFYDRSTLAFFDHHVLEVLLGFLVALGVTHLLIDHHGPAPPSWRRPAVLRALPMSLFLFSWYGAPIYIVIVVLTFFLVGALDILRTGDARAVATAVFRWFSGIFVVVLPLSLLVPWLRMEDNMLMRTGIVAVPIMIGLPLVLRAAAAVARRITRPITVLLLLGGAAGTLLLLLDYVPRSAKLFAVLLSVKTPFIQEQAAVSWELWWNRSGPSLILALAALPLALLDGWRRRDFATRFPAVLVSLMVVGLWLKTHDYDYAAGAFTPLAGALGLAIAVDLVGRWRRAQSALATVMLVVIAALYWPLREAELRLPQKDRFENAMHLQEGVVAALRFVRDHAPPLAAPLDTLDPKKDSFRHPPGNYGVMTYWDLGHYVSAIGERPAIAMGVMETSTALWMVQTDEEESIRELSAHLQPGEDFRYVVVDARTAADVFGTMVRMVGWNEKDYKEISGEVDLGDGRRMKIFDFGPKYRSSMIGKLFFDPSDLAHYRLVFNSPQQHAVAYYANLVGFDGTSVVRRAVYLDSPERARVWREMARRGGITRSPVGFIYGVDIEPTARVYEKVLGAHLTGGQAPPGAKVEARLKLRFRGGGELNYHRDGVVDASGGYSLVVPYPAGDPRSVVSGDSEVTPAGPYQIFINDQPAASARVSLEEVRAGATVPVTAR